MIMSQLQSLCIILLLISVYCYVEPDLESGWDEDGETIYGKQMMYIAKQTRSNKDSIMSIATFPTENVSYFVGTGDDNNTIISDFVKNLDGINVHWEPETFTTFLKYLPSAKHYIDIGTWIGPTLFFATQLVPFSLGIEADPSAFAYVSYNLALNRNKRWSEHTYLLSAAVGVGSDVSSTPVQMSMLTSQPGNSCSGVGKVIITCGNNNSEKLFRWKVNAYSLPNIMHAYNIPSKRTTFIKLDVESYECQLLPSWMQWLSQLGNNKPTLYISFHSQIVSCSNEEYIAIAEVAKMYRKISCEKYDKDSPCLNEDQSNWALDTGTAIFTDLHSHMEL